VHHWLEYGAIEGSSIPICIFSFSKFTNLGNKALGIGIGFKSHGTCGTVNQGCHKGRFSRKITVRTSADVVRTSARIRVYPADAVLPADGFLSFADAVKTASTRTQPSVRADTHLHPRGHECGREKKNYYYYFFHFFLKKIFW
jgi:hypothetical protein